MQISTLVLAAVWMAMLPVSAAFFQLVLHRFTTHVRPWEYQTSVAEPVARPLEEIME